MSIVGGMCILDKEKEKATEDAEEMNVTEFIILHQTTTSNVFAMLAHEDSVWHKNQSTYKSGTSSSQ